MFIYAHTLYLLASNQLYYNQLHLLACLLYCPEARRVPRLLSCRLVLTS
jgi:hypothetical protein